MLPSSMTAIVLVRFNYYKFTTTKKELDLQLYYIFVLIYLYMAYIHMKYVENNHILIENKNIHV